MAVPSVEVEIAFDSGFSTAEDGRTWTDVSTYVEDEISIGRGRSDELAAPDPSNCTLTLDNRDGRFTPEKASSPYYPNVKKGKPIRVSVRYSDDDSGNFLSANQASMETSIADWSAGGSVPPTLASSTTHADDGTKSLRITWGTGGTFPQAGTTCTGLVVGRTYTAQARVWVTTGTPNVLLVIPGGVASGTATATKGAFATISVTFIATASSHAVQVWPATAPTSGQQLWVDSVMVDEGSAVGTFTTSSPPIRTRFTGYIDDWPLIWPDGSDSAATITITATSRRARIGQTAPLTSAIRAAYLATGPDAYWPMTETVESVHVQTGQQIFRDITNTENINQIATQLIGSFFSTAAAPVVSDGTLGPTDEKSLVKMPEFTNAALVGTFSHYVGAGSAISIGAGGEVTVEAVARIRPTGGNVTCNVLGLYSTDLLDQLAAGISDNGSSMDVYAGFTVFDHDTRALLDSQVTPTPNNAEYLAATDGEIHHYAVTLGGGTGVKFYFDGALMGSLTATSAFTQRFTVITFGENTLNATMWIGHGAVHDRALTAAEVLDHANAATAATETEGDRVVRVAGRVGVPAAEVDTEAGVAMPLGRQSEDGRSATEVIDEIASSTGGVVFDGRDGHLVYHPRNHRYNLTAAFTLNATTQEIGGDLTATHDGRYLVNTVTLTRTGADAGSLPTMVTDDTSIDEFGVYAKSIEIVSASDQALAAVGTDQFYRYAQPRTRISQVSVDAGNLSAAQRTALLTADVGTLFAISNLPAQAPTSTMNLFIEGYSETITATSHGLSVNTTPGDLYSNVAVLDDAAHDLLDSGITLAY